MNTTIVIAIIVPFVLITIASLIALVFMKQSVSAYAHLAKRAEYERDIMELNAKKNKELAEFVFNLCKSICQSDNLDDIVYRFTMLKCALTLIEFDDDNFIISHTVPDRRDVLFDHATLTEQLVRLLDQDSAKEAVGEDTVSAFDRFMKLVEGIHTDELETYRKYADEDYKLGVSAGLKNAKKRHVIVTASKHAAEMLNNVLDVTVVKDKCDKVSVSEIDAEQTDTAQLEPVVVNAASGATE